MPSTRAILLVEDEELVRNYLKDLLTKNAWTVTAVGSGDEALTLLEAFDFDVVLCDLDLGRGPSGLNVLSRMPSRNQSRPFVILTAHGSTGRCREAFLLGATDFLEKPLSRASLLGTLDQAIAGAIELPIDSMSEDVALELLDDAAGVAHVRRAIQIIERRCAEIDLTVADVAREVGVSPEHLARLCRARIGRSPLDYLHHVRIGRAEHLLANSRLSVYEVARESGYKRTSEFSSWFRRLRGSTPSALRA